MSPSTSDSVHSKVKLDFRFDGMVVASLRIAARCDAAFDRTCDGIPEYMDAEGCENVLFTDDDGSIDSESPIVVYTGMSRVLSPLLLLEETDYDLELSISNGDVTDEMAYLRSQGGNLFFKTNCFGGFGGRTIYSLYSKSYVGKGYFDIVFKGVRIEIPFELRSKKIEYITQYPRMLSDIAEFSVPLILDHRSPLFRNYSAASTPESTPYEDYLVLDYIFNKLGFESACEHVVNHLYSELSPEDSECIDGCAPYMDASGLISMVAGGSLKPHENGIILDRYNPSRVNTRCYVESYDNRENRLVKDLLLTMQSMLHGLRDRGCFENSAYISSGLDRMTESVDGFLAGRWLSDVGSLCRIPFESTVLQMRRGYRDLFEMYQLLGVGIAFSQDDAPGLFEGHNKRVYEVYEYWCFTRLYRALHDMSDNKPGIDAAIGGRRGAVSIRGRAVVFSINRNGIVLKVSLFYNRDFDSSNERFRSYSVRLRPDYTLLIERDGIASIINFDAKYKLKPKRPEDTQLDDSGIDGGCWEYDIYKMHTYRDALIKSLGSYVLYPGSEAESEHWNRYTKPCAGVSWEARDDVVLPSVGSICLTPGSENDGQLLSALNMVFDRICSDIPMGRC